MAAFRRTDHLGIFSLTELDAGCHAHGRAWACEGQKAHFRRGKVRQRHGRYAQARDDFQAAVGHFTSFLENAEREMPAEEPGAERIACVNGERHEAREGLAQCKGRLSGLL